MRNVPRWKTETDRPDLYVREGDIVVDREGEEPILIRRLTDEDVQALRGDDEEVSHA